MSRPRLSALFGAKLFGVCVPLPGGREAERDTDGAAGLQAQVMRHGMLAGYLPRVEGSEDFEARIVDAIARTGQAVARRRTVAPASAPCAYPRRRRLPPVLDGFRYK